MANPSPAGQPKRFDYKPHAGQAELHNIMQYHRFCVPVCHRRWGKTVYSVETLNDAAVRFTNTETLRDGRFGYFAPFRNQAKDVAWMYLKYTASTVPDLRINESDLYVEYPHNGARVTLYGADNAEARRGVYFDGVVCDEYGSMKPHVWPEIIRPALADREGWGIFPGTPKGMNQYHELFEFAKTEPGWWAAMYRADETNLPWLPESELRLAKAVMSDAQYRQEFLCDFSASSDNVLITIDIASEASQRVVANDSQLRGLPRILGVDVARFGDDRSVICKRWGHVAYPFEVFEDIDNMHLASVVANRIVDWKPDAIMIDGGRGEGVIDRLRQLGHQNVFEVQFGAKASNPHYRNKRTEMWDLMRQWLVNGGVIPKGDIDLKSELCMPTYDFTPAGQMILESKDKAKTERGMRSPDKGDALAVTFAEPVIPIGGNQELVGAGVNLNDYAAPNTFAQPEYVLPWDRN